MKKIVLIIALFWSFLGAAQVFNGWKSIGKTTSEIQAIANDAGRFEYNSVTGSLWYNDGSSWIDVGSGGGGSGDVSAAAVFGTDNSLIRADGTGKGVQSSGVIVDDTDNITGLGDLLPATTLTENIGNGTFRWGSINANSFDVNSSIVFNPTDTEPGATEGRIYFDDSENTLKQYNGTAWEALNGGGGGLANVVEDLTPEFAADLDMNDNGFDNLNFSIYTNAANANQVSQLWDGTNQLFQIAPNAGDILRFSFPLNEWQIGGSQIITDTTADVFLPLAGGTMTGGLNMGGFNITGLGSLTTPNVAGASFGSSTLYFANMYSQKFDFQSTAVDDIDWRLTPNQSGGHFRFEIENSATSDTFGSTYYTLNQTGAPALTTDLIDKAYADANYGTGSGDFLASGAVPMTGDLDMNQNNIINANNATADFYIIDDPSATNRNWATSVNFNNQTLDFMYEDSPGAGTYGSIYSLSEDGVPTSATDLVDKAYADALGDVTKVGTPIDNQVAVWTGNGTAEGTSSLTYNGSTLGLTGDLLLNGGGGQLQLQGATSGQANIVAPAVAGTPDLTLPTTTGTFALTSDITGTNSGTNTGDQTITLTGDVTGTGTGSFAATISGNAVTQAEIADDAIQEEHLKAVNAAVDEYSVTYESTTGDFEYVRKPDSDISTRTTTTPVTAMTIQSQADYTTDGPPVAGTLVFISDAIDEHKFIVPLGAVDADIAVADGVTLIDTHDAITITRIEASMETAPTGTGATFDIRLDDGTPASILSTLITIDATERFTSTAATQAVVSDATIPADSFLLFDIDVVGSTIAGNNATITIYYTID